MKQPQRISATAAIAAATCLVFVPVALVGALDWAAAAGGFIPARASGVLTMQGAAPVWLTPLTATLVHAGVVHLFMNMIMLLFCGKLVEEAIGGSGLVVAYVVGAYAAALGQYLEGPHAAVPMVGASGAASAVLGVYALLYGREKAAVAHPVLNRLVNIAWLAAGWIGIQILFGYAASSDGMPIAVGAHIGGFIAGLLLARPLLLWRYRHA